MYNNKSCITFVLNSHKTDSVFTKFQLAYSNILFELSVEKVPPSFLAMGACSAL